jgi:hypothetical protein
MGLCVCGLESPAGSDVVVVAPDKILFLEIKASSLVSAEQRKLGMRVTELGFVWAVMRSLDDVGKCHSRSWHRGLQL